MKYVLLCLPCVLAMAVPVYNSIEPKLLGFPFFFWCQLALVPLTAVCILLVYIGERR